MESSLSSSNGTVPILTRLGGGAGFVSRRSISLNEGRLSKSHCRLTLSARLLLIDTENELVMVARKSAVSSRFSSAMKSFVKLDEVPSFFRKVEENRAPVNLSLKFG